MNALSLLTNGIIWPGNSSVVYQTVVLPPNEGQALLVKALQLPLPTGITEVDGIFQSDIIIRSALIAGIADLRANPWNLDYIFASLPKDSLTQADYGEMEVARAKEWFLATDFPVIMNFHKNEPKFPCITISLESSQEDETTLGDIHYVPSQRTEADWPTKAGPMRPVAYSASSGMMKLPLDKLGDVVLAPGMVIIDTIGRMHAVLEVLDKDVVSIEPGTVADFSRLMLKGQRPQKIVMLESVVMRETYNIGLWVHGEPHHLTFLYSVVTYILYKYKQHLLEARGFAKSRLVWGGFTNARQFEPEVVFTRQATLTGYVRNSWPKAVHDEIQGVAIDGMQVSVNGSPGKVFVNEKGVKGGDGTE